MPFDATSSFLTTPSSLVVGRNTTLSLELRATGGGLPNIPPAYPVGSYVNFEFYSNGALEDGTRTVISTSMMTFVFPMEFNHYSLSSYIVSTEAASWMEDYTLSASSCVLLQASRLDTLLTRA